MPAHSRRRANHAALGVFDLRPAQRPVPTVDVAAPLTPRRLGGTKRALFLGDRLMAGRKILILAIKVRVLVPEPTLKPLDRPRAER